MEWTIAASLSALAASIVGSIKILTNSILKRQNRQHAHEMAMAGRFEKHEAALATRFENIAKSYEGYAATERNDRKEANERVMTIHEQTITVMGDVKDAVQGMRLALDHNTKVIQEKMDAKQLPAVST